MANTLQITDLGGSILVKGIDNVRYVDNGELTFPKNSVILVIDESDVATFKSASNFDNLFSAKIGNITIGGASVTKNDIAQKFDAIANEESGGGQGGVTPEQVEIMIDTATEGLVADAEYDSIQHVINFKNEDGDIVGQIDATDFIKDGMVQNVEISNGYLVITFNTDSGKQPISIQLTDIFNPSNYYNKTEIDNNLQTLSNTLYGVIQDVDDALTAHTTNTTVHVTAQDKTNWNNKADMSDIPDVSDFVDKETFDTKEEVISRALTELNQTKADIEDLPDMTDYYNKTQVDNNLQTLSNTLNSVINTKADASRLGGLSLVKLTQSEYDSLATYDNNVIYVIVG